jgi:heparan-alpha-glucosaminide N-acetyltransferase
VKGYRRWTFPLVVVGMNSIFIYSLSQLFRTWILRGVGGLTYKFGFLGPLGEIPQNILVLCIMWYCCHWLYRRRIFFKF